MKIAGAEVTASKQSTRGNRRYLNEDEVRRWLGRAFERQKELDAFWWKTPDRVFCVVLVKPWGKKTNP